MTEAVEPELEEPLFTWKWFVWLGFGVAFEALFILYLRPFL